jgi:F-type H+-transporting ATPase subunit epsilon
VAEKLHFSLVSPEREVYVGEVDQVDAPGSEGDFGVLAGHAPFMTALREGFVIVHEGEHLHRFEVQGGFADVSPAGLTILAERVRDAEASTH